MSALLLSETGQRKAYQKQFFDLCSTSGQLGIYDTEKSNNKAPAGVSIEGHKIPTNPGVVNLLRKNEIDDDVSGLAADIMI